MNARQIEVFRSIMRLGTLTAAAQALGVSQPALSQLLLHAEDQLGYKLFRRLRGRLVPTPEALQLYPEAERLHREIEDFRRHAVGLKDGAAGTVRLVASAPPSLSFLPRALAAFRAALPGVRLSVFVLPVQMASEMLARGDADLGVALSDVSTALVAAETIGHAELVCVLPAGHRLARRKAVTAEALQQETLISYRPDSLPGQLLMQGSARAGLDYRTQVEIDVSIIALSFVQQGLGVALVDGLIPWESHPGLVVRPFRPLLRLPVAILTGTRRPLSLPQARLREGLRAAFAAHAAAPAARGLLSPA